MSDFVLRDARLVPLRGEPAPSYPVDVLVTDGVVTEVGPGLERPAYADEVRADGRWLMPGLWDQHVHLGQWTLATLRLDLNGTRSVEDALGRVATRIAEGPD